MGLFAVTTDMDNRNDEPIWFPFDAPDYADLDDLFDGLLQDGMAIGFRLKARREGNVLIETERDRAIIGKTFRLITQMNPDKLVRDDA